MTDAVNRQAGWSGRRAVLAVLAMLCVGFAALAAASRASAATSGVVWGQTPTLTAAGGLGSLVVPTGITCSTTGNCVAVGVERSGSSGGSFVLVEHNHVWGEPVAPTTAPPLAASGATAPDAFSAVSCMDAASCVAVGYYANSSGGEAPLVMPFTLSGTGVSFGTPQAPSLPSAPDAAAGAAAQQSMLTGVSCQATSCTAVGYYQDAAAKQMPLSTTGSLTGTWTATEISGLPSGGSAATGANLTAISCPPAGACQAVGSYAVPDGAVVNSTPWTVTLGGPDPTGVAAPAPAGSSATTWTALAPAPFGGVTTGLTTVSCPSAGSCVAAGSYSTSSGAFGLAIPIVGGIPQAPSSIAGGTVSYGAVVFSVASLSSISCFDLEDCVAVGLTVTPSLTEVPTVTTETAGTWSALSDLPSGGASTMLTTALWCQDATDCVVPVTIGGGLSYSSFFDVSAAALTAGTTDLPAATVGHPYSARLTALGGSGQADWAVTTGSLPAGLSLDAATGVISGTPTSAAHSLFIVTDTDAGPPAQTVNDALSLTVAPAPVATVPLSATGSAPSANPTPVHAAATRPAVRIASLRVRGRVATVVLACRGAACAGTVKLMAVEHLKGKLTTAISAIIRRGKTKHAKPRTKRLTLAQHRYAITAGRRETLRLVLPARDAKLLRRLKRIGAQLTVTPTGSRRPTVNRAVTFRAVKVKRRRRK